MRDEKASGPKQAKGKRTNASATVRPVLSFRAQADLYEKVKGRADASQRAVSEELESLVRLALDLTENRATEIIMRYVGTAVSLAEITTRKKWNEDKNTAVMANNAARIACDMMLVPHAGNLSGDSIEEKAGKAGAAIVARTLALYAGQSADKVQEIGSEDVNDFTFSDVQQRFKTGAPLQAFRDQAEAAPSPQLLARLLRDGAPAQPVTPDEVAGMVDARGQLPPEIGDRAAFDDAVSGLPLVKAEKSAKHRPYNVGAALKRNRTKAPA